MKKFTKLLLGLAFIGVIGVTSAKAAAATGYGHNVIIGVASGKVGSECFSNGAAFSKAMCLENNKAIQVRVADIYGKVYTATSAGRNSSYTYTPKSPAAGDKFSHSHGYTVWTIS